MEFTVQETLQDALIAHKFMIHMYTQFGIECSNSQLRDLFSELREVAEDHDFKIFTIMHQKGLYPTTPAASKDVKQAVKMHTEMQIELENKLNSTKKK